MELDATFWDNRYQEQNMGWDIGHISPPIKAYIDQLEDRSIHILIPGCGNAYEGQYLFEQGFTHTHLIDLSPTALANFAERVEGFPEAQLICEDFFQHEGQYDLIIEQTFFCAIHPSLRAAYAQQMHRLLKPGGKLVGLLFNDPLHDDRPPFGGTPLEYLGYFQPHFDTIYMKEAYNSIEPRMGRELFINLQKEG